MGKYATATKNLHSPHDLCVLPVPDDDSLLKQIAKALGGRKQLAGVIGRSESLVDLAITGERSSPMDQCRNIIEKLYDTGHQEFALLVCEGILETLVDRAITRTQFEALKQLARR